MRVILLDIEGTTTPVDFVYKTLFPFARERVRSYLESALSIDPEIQAAVDGLHEEHDEDRATDQKVPDWIDGPVDRRLQSAVVYFEWLMDRDRKSRPLKMLQGKIWEEGYRGGTLHGEVYPDVPVALRRWRALGVRAGIYSSGSVLAQKLLFAHSNAGDLTSFFQWHFDTSVGSKMDAASYQRIAETIPATPEGILFVSDVAKELDAAHLAGLHTLLCVRAGTPPRLTASGTPPGTPPRQTASGTPPPAERPADSGRYSVIHTFDEVVG